MKECPLYSVDIVDEDDFLYGEPKRDQSPPKRNGPARLPKPAQPKSAIEIVSDPAFTQLLSSIGLNGLNLAERIKVCENCVLLNLFVLISGGRVVGVGANYIRFIGVVTGRLYFDMATCKWLSRTSVVPRSHRLCAMLRRGKAQSRRPHLGVSLSNRHQDRSRPGERMISLGLIRPLRLCLLMC